MQLSAQTQHKQQNSNCHNKIVEFTHDAIQSHNPKPATAATKSWIFPTHLTHTHNYQPKHNTNKMATATTKSWNLPTMQSKATPPKLATATTKSRIFPTHLTHATISPNTTHKQQNGNRCNKIVEYPQWSHPKDATRTSANMIQTTLSGNSCNKIMEFSHGGGGSLLKISHLQKPLKYLVL